MKPLLQVENLSIDFISEKKITQAVKNISFSVNRGEVTAIVGESGSGKTVTSLSILKFFLLRLPHILQVKFYFLKTAKMTLTC